MPKKSSKGASSAKPMKRFYKSSSSRSTGSGYTKRISKPKPGTKGKRWN